MRRVLIAFLALATLLTVAPAAHAERRVALVIGNGSYTKVGRLPNPSRDAAAIETMLRGAGFDAVVVQRDLGRDAMRRALRDFSDQVHGADIAVVFYAGHGIEVNGSNYLIPVDAVLERDIDVEDEAVPLERVSQVLEPARRLRLIILDACRDNPFAPAMRRIMAGRSIGRGLAQVDVTTAETLVAFAAKAGSTAADGQGSNSPYTSALVKHLATPGLDIRLALGRVRDEVLRSTGSRQEPFVYGSLGGAEIAIVPGAASPSSPPPVSSSSSSSAVEAVRVCREVEGMTNSAVLTAMAATYRGTLVADCIAARLADLKQANERKQASSKAEGERICTNVKSIANVTLLKAMAAEHRGKPGVEACIASRIVALEAQKTALLAPSGTPGHLDGKPAPGEPHYGAIAYSPSTDAHGWVFDTATRESAVQQATTNCSRYARDCVVPIWFRDGCGALAVGNGRGYGTGWGVTREIAEGHALQTCNKYTSSCTIKRWTCTGGEQRSPAGGQP